jgi:hypothetical protein
MADQQQVERHVELSSPTATRSPAGRLSQVIKQSLANPNESAASPANSRGPTIIGTESRVKPRLRRGGKSVKRKFLAEIAGAGVGNRGLLLRENRNENPITFSCHRKAS